MSTLKELLEIEGPSWDAVYDGMCRSPVEMVRHGLLNLEGKLYYLPTKIKAVGGTWLMQTRTDGRDPFKSPFKYYMFCANED